MDIMINHHTQTPIYLQIANQIKEMILKGELTDGFVLPSERTMAQMIGVHRNTIIKAYHELKAEDFLASVQGKGYSVSYPTQEESGEENHDIAWFSMIKEEYLNLRITFDEMFSKSYSSGNISFAGGIASAEEYSMKELAVILTDMISGHNNETYSYTPYQGLYSLRKNIANFMKSKGVQGKPNEIQILSETNQALDYLAALFIKPGDVIITEEPVSPDVYRTFTLAGGKMVTVPMDEDGMLCDSLEPLIVKHRPKFIYVNPDYHNPTGIVMSLERRKTLLSLCHKYRIPIIEEDGASEICFEGRKLPPIKALDQGNHVIYLYSFGLTFAPGVRMAFVLADKTIIKSLRYVVSMRLISLDSISQKLLSGYMEKGFYQKNIKHICTDYKEKRDLMCRCLDEFLALDYTIPRGGVYLWCRLPREVDSKTLYGKAISRGVSYIPGSVFYPRGSKGENYIRLNFSYPGKTEIEKGIQLLAEAMQESRKAVTGT
ncbi:PLP-dependent aminotransferase family protein [Sinanaerobacter chloroacetimidivorans]|uniref:PLP-dependent aminotransferase family protein n=1 Tax=Sinanaerobacter chloroacetimidivorans TaxID=2818044 RepID=A0A8J7W5F7_9FIRM|nr:PLP-dependent aminotransferase family protein [Sinanaerobacter chloroacetimidivorans]MBR0599698.1 PLP-dependent aminotransferase family protein [Sinanaerobacter chloroacetimidivorans]